MRTRIATILFAAAAGALPAGASAAPPSPREELARHLARLSDGAVTVAGERLRRPADVLAFYDSLGNQPAWVPARLAHGEVAGLVDLVTATGAHGLEPRDYHADLLNALLAAATYDSTGRRPPGPKILAVFDLLITDAVLAYAADLGGSRLPPGAGEPRWGVPAKAVDPVEILMTARAGAGGVLARLQGLAPDTPAYHLLRAALPELRAVIAAGGWPSVPAGPTLVPGHRGPRVAALRARLAFPATDGDPQFFAADLAAAVRTFQRRHGLAADAAVGPRTLAALAVPAAARLQQVELALERLRWVPYGPAPRQVWVNIAAGQLEVVAGDSTVLAMRAIVGRADRPTPALSSRITYLEINPYWNIPQKLARRDVLPHVRRDQAYLSEHGIRVFASWRPESPEIDPAGVDWQALASWNFAYKLQQAPGPLNPLGQMKFLFANPFSVYLHDTPRREAFAAQARFFSSGCVRVENPLALALELVTDPASGFVEQLETALGSGETRTLHLPRPVPVHLVYFTAWADAEGALHFRDDVYGDDRRLAEFLAGRRGPLVALPSAAGTGRESAAPVVIQDTAAGAALPGAEGSGVEVDEAGAGVVTDTAEFFPLEPPAAAPGCCDRATARRWLAPGGGSFPWRPRGRCGAAVRWWPANDSPRRRGTPRGRPAARPRGRAGRAGEDRWP